MLQVTVITLSIIHTYLTFGIVIVSTNVSNTACSLSLNYDHQDQQITQNQIKIITGQLI